MNALSNYCSFLQKKASVMYIITDTETVVNTLVGISEIPVIVYTSNRKLLEKLKNKQNVRIMKPHHRGNIINTLYELQNILLRTYTEKLIKYTDSVLCVISNDTSGVLLFSQMDIGIINVIDEIKTKIDITVFESVLRLAYEIMIEGREGKNIGTLFIIGDTEKVIEKSKQSIINPFKGHSEKKRDIVNQENWETIKQFAVLDGAFIVKNDGIISSAGRYIDIEHDVKSDSGFGGRHLAAKSITLQTDAIAISVSSSKVLRVFKDGKVILKMS